MKRILLGATALTLSAMPAISGGIERSDQSVGILFEDAKNYVELSYGRVRPSVTGTDLLSQQPIGNIADRHYLPGIAYKTDINDKVTLAFIYNQFYGADIDYPVSPTTPALAGTAAKVNSEGYTFLARYKFDENWSVHGGIRASKADASVTLSGLGYGGLSGYSAKLDSDWALGYSLGAAYERPDIALRVALTYQSKVTHHFPTTEYMGGNVVGTGTETKVTTPEAVTLDFQSGVAANTLVFGSIRWVHWSQFVTTPAFFGAQTRGSNLTNLDNSTSFTLGVGRKFNENWSGSVFVNYEKGGSDESSPLAPTSGYKGIGIAAVYTRDNMKITGGIRYLKLGDSYATTARNVSQFKDNYAVAAGVKVGFSF